MAKSRPKNLKKLESPWITLRTIHIRSRIIIFINYWFYKTFRIKLPIKTLLEILAFVGPAKEWFTYLQKRESRTDIHFAIKQLEKVIHDGEVLVEAGCGIGNFSHILRRDIPSKKISYIGIDYLFANVLIANMYFANENTQFICADLNKGISLKNKSISSLMFLDSFSAMKDKQKIINESYRTLKHKGNLLLINVNNIGSIHGEGIGPQDLTKILKYKFNKIQMKAQPYKGNHWDTPQKIDKKDYSCISVKN